MQNKEKEYLNKLDVLYEDKFKGIISEETYKRIANDTEGLLKKIKGRKIIDCKVLYKDIIVYPTPDTFIKQISNQEIIDIKRKGKFLIFETNNHYLVSHLRMEGKLFLVDRNESIKPYTMIELYSKSKKIIFLDTRMFGTFNIYKTNWYRIRLF